MAYKSASNVFGNGIVTKNIVGTKVHTLLLENMAGHIFNQHENVRKSTILIPELVQKPKSVDELASFERAMLLTGYGRYNLNLLLVCGLITVSFGFQFGLSSYILPSTQCDLQLSSSEMGLLNAGFLIGAVIGSIPSGAIADATGRKKVLIWSLFLDGCATVLSSLSQNFTVLFMFRCLNGIMVGGPSTILISFLGEFHAEKAKNTVTCYAGLFWSIGRVLLPALGWIVIPLKFNIVVYGLMFNSWRLFVGILSLPSFIGAFLLSKYPESPKFLLSQGRDVEALEIMREMFATNTKQEPSKYPVGALICTYSTSHDGVHSLSATLKKMWKQLHRLLSPPLGKYTVLTASILFTNMFGNFGLGLWFPELFNRFEIHYKSHPNTSVSVCELAHFQEENYEPVDAELIEYLNDASNSTMEINSTMVHLLTDETIVICDSSVDARVFVNTIIIGFTCLLGNLASGYLANRWERRVMPIATMLISGVCGCAIYFLRSSMQNLIASCLFTAFIQMANIILYMVIIDVFPTNVTAMATAVSSVAARLGAILCNILFGLLLDISCEVPIFLTGGLVILGGLLGFLLPTKPLEIPKQAEQIHSQSVSKENPSKDIENKDSNCTS